MEVLRNVKRICKQSGEAFRQLQTVAWKVQKMAKKPADKAKKMKVADYPKIEGRCTPEQKADIEEAAALEERSTSWWIVRQLLPIAAAKLKAAGRPVRHLEKEGSEK